MPKVERCEKCGKMLLKNVRCINGCAVSSTGKVDLLFGLNNSIKPLLY